MMGIDGAEKMGVAGTRTQRSSLSFMYFLRFWNPQESIWWIFKEGKLPYMCCLLTSPLPMLLRQTLKNPTVLKKQEIKLLLNAVCCLREWEDFGKNLPIAQWKRAEKTLFWAMLDKIDEKRFFWSAGVSLPSQTQSSGAQGEAEQSQGKLWGSFWANWEFPSSHMGSKPLECSSAPLL